MQTGKEPSPSKKSVKKDANREKRQIQNDEGSVLRAKSDVFLNIYDNAKELSDFSIKTKSKQYPIHKKVMMVRSSEYYKLFTTSKAKDKDAPKDVQLESVPSEIMEKEIIKFLYTEKVELTPENVADIMKASTDLRLKSLREKCEQYIRSYTVDNVLSLIPVCKEKLLMKQLAREMTDFVYGKFPEIIQTEGFRKLDLSAVCQLLAAYELRIHGENKVFHAAMLWLNSNQDQIIKSAEELLKNVHFYCLSPRDIAAYLTINTDVLKVPACKTCVSNAFRFHAVQHSKNKLDSSLKDGTDKEVEPISGKNGKIFTFGGTALRETKTGSAVSSEIMVSDLDEHFQPKKWSGFGTMPEPRCFHSVVIACKDLFLIGGLVCGVNVPKKDFLNPVPSNKMFRYNTESGQWTEVSAMQAARMCFAATVAKDHIFVFGGLGVDQKILAEAECYSTRLNMWVSLAPMVYARAGLCAAPLTDDSILVVGGYSINNNMKDLITSVECYSLSQNSWTMKNPRNVGVSSSGLEKVNGYLYLLGGGIYNEQTRDIESTAIIETYLVQHDCWLPVASMDIPRLEIGTTVSGNLVYVVGGLCTQSNAPLSSVECFNASLSTMIRAPSTPTNLPRGLLGARVAVLSS